ncbi:MAG: type II toxin-antitoxin system RelE/ParE family toxin [Cyanobacteria bacterium P01_A01_bin.17]
MRIFKNAWFNRYARKERLTDEVLQRAVAQVEQGLLDADLGGSVIKQRIARKGQGKSGGYRTIILYRQGDKAFFMYGFAKSDRDTLTEDELIAFRKAAKEYLALSDEQIAQLLETKALTEV